MFKIGEFAQIARVSGRLLRYYDSLGLLRPVRIDPATGYRYYSAAQLPQLNRILALKDLGLTLDQIARLLDDKVSVDEIRGMLMLRKAELERSIREEDAQLRHVESRLQQIEQHGSLTDYDIVIKSAPEQNYLAMRAVFPQMDAAVAMLRDVARVVTAKVPERNRDKMVVVAHSDFEEEDLDLEIGFSVAREVKPIRLSNEHALSMRLLPEVVSLATLARSGPNYQSHFAFGALGLWIEANNYRIAGPCREVFLDVPFQSEALPDPVVEIQFPVEKAA